MKKIKEIIEFLKAVANDSRIPERDKKVLLVLIALIISPVDLIPDWIPIIGVLDDVVMIALILDYFFEILDPQILLSHYPFGMKSFIYIKKASRIISQLTPNFIRNRVWKYKPDLYSGL